ncbi:hypothetical protein [Streptomyces sp. CO7]
MARLNEPVSAQEIFAVMTNPDFSRTHATRVVWAYLRAVADPQRIKPMSEVLGMAENTVWRALTVLETKGLARKVNGVWLSEVPSSNTPEEDR